METITERAALGIGEACRYVGISRAGLYRLLGQDGGIRSITIGRRRLILKSDLDKYLLERLEAAATGGNGKGKN
jgi:excisionase family DNA binding protein